MSSFSFPLLSAKEIVAYLRGSYNDFEISEKDIHSPERKVWQKIYTLFLFDCYPHLTADHMNQVSITAEFSYPEIHEAAIPVFNLLKCMKALLAVCGINDFKMSDIIHPRSSRVIRNASALINFCLFRQERIPVLEKLQSDHDALRSQHDSLVRDNEELKQRINCVKARQAEAEVEVDAMLKNIKEWNGKISVIHQSLLSKQRESSENKVLIAELKSQLIHYNQQLIEARERNTKLAARIVPSPDRMKDEMKRMQRHLVQAEQTKHGLGSRLGKLTKHHQLLQEKGHEADIAIRSVEAIQEEDNKQKEVLTDISNIQDESSNRQTEIKHLSAKSEQLSLQIKTKQEKMEKLAIQHNLRMYEKRETLEDLKNELSCAQQEYGEKHCQSIALETEIMKARHQLQEEMAEHEETVATMGDKHKELLEVLDSYHQRFGESCQKLANAT